VAQSDADSLLAAMPIPAIAIGPEQRILAANAGAYALFGSSIQSRHFATVLRQPALLECLEAVQSGRTARSETAWMVTEAMSEVSYQVTVARAEIGADPVMLVSFVDTSDREEAGQMRRDFVANVSHELRTPLTALLGFIETLREAARDDASARERFLKVMEMEANRMNRLVSDLLSLSRVESEQRVRPRTCADVSVIIRSVASSLRPLANEAGVTLELSGTVESAEVPADPDQLAQVFSNLIENAIKYGHTGERVVVTLTRSDHDAGIRGPAVIVTISDDGDGFDPVHIPRLTERFYRIDDHRSRELGGTGLGLAIVKHIMQRHRGSLRIESEPGQGSRFSVVLPEE
jgi:two-component system phosphate regulon sensor histidine kinase PhoR